MGKYLFFIVIVAFLILGAIILILRGNQNINQQIAINCAIEKFHNFKEDINSQCLGVCGEYAVDIVNVPRTEEDNLQENQCEDYRTGKVLHFIELDKNGEIVRIV